MSQYYALPKFSLRHAPIGTRVLISLFLVGTLAAIALGLYVFFVDTGFSPKGVIEHYLGNESDPDAKDLRFPMPERELLEILHIHAFTILILLFILFHFLGLVRRLGERTKIAIYVAGFFSMSGVLASPWLVRFASPTFAQPMLWCGVLFATTCVIAGLVTLWEIWCEA